MYVHLRCDCHVLRLTSFVTDKVIDSSDVILHVLDARDPLGTRCRSVEKYLKEEAPHKHLVFVLNKCDLVPTKVAVSLHSPSMMIWYFVPQDLSQDIFRCLRMPDGTCPLNPGENNFQSWNLRPRPGGQMVSVLVDHRGIGCVPI